MKRALKIIENVIEENIFEIEGEENIFGFEIGKITDKKTYLEGYKYYIWREEHDLLSSINCKIREQAQSKGIVGEVSLLAASLIIANEYKNKLDPQLYQSMRILILKCGIIRVSLMDEKADKLRLRILTSVKNAKYLKSFADGTKKKLLKKTAYSLSEEYMIKGTDDCKKLKELFDKSLAQKEVETQEQCTAKPDQRATQDISQVTTTNTIKLQMEGNLPYRYGTSNEIQLIHEGNKILKEVPGKVR